MIPVPPQELEERLQALWDEPSQVGRMRACLFNLVLFLNTPSCEPYWRAVLQQVIQKFPCRLLLLTRRPHLEGHPPLETSIALTPGGAAFACDTIEVSYCTDEAEASLPFLLLPHLVPDLPTNLVWTASFSSSLQLLEALGQIVDRTIFDSESFQDLIQCAHSLLDYRQQHGGTVADLNWARGSSWRELLRSYFSDREKAELLRGVQEIHVSYNSVHGASYQHTQFQALYLQAWLAQQLQGTYLAHKIGPSEALFSYRQKGTGQEFPIRILGQDCPYLSPGTVDSLLLRGRGVEIHFRRQPSAPHQIEAHLSTGDYCEVPIHYIVGRAEADYSLIREITRQGEHPLYESLLTIITQWETI